MCSNLVENLGHTMCTVVISDDVDQFTDQLVVAALRCIVSTVNLGLLVTRFLTMSTAPGLLCVQALEGQPA